MIILVGVSHGSQIHGVDVHSGEVGADGHFVAGDVLIVDDDHVVTGRSFELEAVDRENILVEMVLTESAAEAHEEGSLGCVFVRLDWH